MLKTGVKFFMKAYKSFCSANIQLHKLANPELKKFLEGLSGNKIKTPASYRYTALSNLFDSRKKEVQEYFNDSRDLFQVFDETTEIGDRIF